MAAMPGETDLHALLAGMEPTLRPDEYVFCNTPPGFKLPDGVMSFATILEDEGLTVVIKRQYRGALRCSPSFRVITLRVHSNLEAIGLTAAVSGALADHHIPANVIAGYHHDHVLVPTDRADEALDVLLLLSAGR